MKKVILLVLLLASMGGFRAKAQNLIPNGSFESGSGNSFTNWWTGAGNGSATFTATTATVQDGSRALQVDVSALGTNPWEIQAVNDAWASKSGQNYTLTFWAKAAAANSRFKAVLQIGSSYAEKSFTVTDSWQKYEWAFTAGADNLQLKFQFLTTGTFYIDNVNIPSSAQLKELLTNGGFENDFANWNNLTGGTASATFAIETADKVGGSKAMKVNVVTPGTNPWDVQSINTAWPSVTGTEYTLTFYAKAATAGKTVRVVQQTNTYASRDFVLTDAWAKYTWTFTAQEAGLQLRLNFPEAGTFYLDNFSILGSADGGTPPPPPYTPTGDPIAQGQTKFLGNVYSGSQLPYFENYWNQVTPENAGKWGSVEATRDVMIWTQLDAAYNFAKANGYPFRYHVLVWGNQQPAWIESLPAAEQLEEIKEWFAAVAARYPDIDYIEVVNEPLHDAPRGAGNGNYIEALGGDGATGWDWILTAFRLAKEYFPDTKLMINDYSIINSATSAQRYLQIVNLLKAENLIDVIGVQGHAFSTTVPAAVLQSNLDLLASSGLPIMVTELDIDGLSDQVQLDSYQRIFPVLWEHPSVIGVTLWGWKPGQWRTDQGAYLAYTNGAERPALVWLREYVQSNTNVHVPAVTSGQTLRLDAAIACNALGNVTATDADANTVLQGWQVVGGTGASIFTIDAATGQVTIAHRKLIDFTQIAYTLTVKVNDGFNTSAAETVTVQIPDKVYVLHKGNVLSINKLSVPDHLAHGDCIGNKGTVTLAGGSTTSNLAGESVGIYPNPASEGRFQVTLSNFSAAQKAVVQLVDMEGRVLLEQEVKQANSVVAQPLKPGLYLVRVIQNKEVTVKKMIIQ